jgi:hypothetical protein
MRPKDRLIENRPNGYISELMNELIDDIKADIEDWIGIDEKFVFKGHECWNELSRKPTKALKNRRFHVKLTKP